MRKTTAQGLLRDVFPAAIRQLARHTTSMARAMGMSGTIAAAVLACAVSPTSAQTYPDRPIKFIAPTTPGSPADILARAVAEGMTRELKVPIVVENKPGADQIIGFEHVARMAPADGYTVGIIGIDGQALLPITKKGLRFNPHDDLTLVAGLAEGRYVLVGPAAAPHKNFKEVMDAIKAAPGRFNYGTSGPVVRIPILMLMNDLNLDMTHIPFKGGGPYAQELAAGNIDLGFVSETSAKPLAGRLRYYGVTGSTRTATEPNVPTFAELGFPKILGPAYALVVRAGTPKAIIDKLSHAAAAALQSPEMKVRSQGLLVTIQYSDAETAKRMLDERTKIYRDIADRVGLKPE